MFWYRVPGGDRSTRQSRRSRTSPVGHEPPFRLGSEISTKRRLNVSSRAEARLAPQLDRYRWLTRGGHSLIGSAIVECLGVL